MKPLSSQDVESELSYAYLHAIATMAGMSCEAASRPKDYNGIDATITAWMNPRPPKGLAETSLHVQLKATVAEPIENNNLLSYFVKGIERYNDLRDDVLTPRILVVLFLPPEREKWLIHSPDQLIIRKCAYWESLKGAPKSTNATGSTIKIPKKQVFSPQELDAIMKRLSVRDIPVYPEYQK